jgi:hypothetical protein
LANFQLKTLDAEVDTAITDNQSAVTQPQLKFPLKILTAETCARRQHESSLVHIGVTQVLASYPSVGVQNFVR